MGKFKLRKWALVYDKEVKKWGVIMYKSKSKIEVRYQNEHYNQVIRHSDLSRFEVWG